MRSKKLLGLLLGLVMGAALSVGVSACDMSGIFIKWSGESVSSSAVQNSSNTQNDDSSSATNTENESSGTASSSLVSGGENDGSSENSSESSDEINSSSESSTESSSDDKKGDSSFDNSDYETDCVIYTISKDGKLARVTGYTGSPTKVKILSTYQDVPVTSIDSRAFYECSSLTSIEITDSVTSIGYDAFSRCRSLTSINVSGNNAKYKSIDGNLYSKNGTTLIQYAIGKTATEFVIPDSVMSIDSNAFAYCSTLTRLKIPDSVRNIGGWGFAYCSRLMSIKIPDGVTSIGGETFYNCSSLTSVIIPDGVMSIGANAFCNCSSLTSVVIPENVTSIDGGAFDACSSLTSVIIPDGVMSIGANAFSGCSGLTGIIIPNSVTSIGECAFYNCSRLTSIEFFDSVTSIGDRAFSYCGSLANINVSENNAKYKSIDGNLYSKDGTILIQYAIGKTATEFIVPDEVMNIVGEAFNNCSCLTSVVISDSVTIGKSTFANCSCLTIYCEAASQPSGWDNDWSGYSSCPVVWDCKNNDVADDGYIYTMINGVRYGIKDGEAAVVRQPSNIQTANIPASITYKNNMYSVTSIGGSAFRSCSSLTSVIIPDCVTSIAGYAFYMCDCLTIYCEAASQPSGWNRDWNYGSSSSPVVWDCNNNDVADDGYIYAVIDGIRYGIKNGEATVVEQPSNIQTANIPASIMYKDTTYAVTAIRDGAFFYCSSLTSISVSEDNAIYKSIDGNLYSKDGTMLIQYAIGKTTTEFIISDSVAYIFEKAFGDCSSLTSVVIPDSVMYIGDDAFTWCSCLKEVYYNGTKNDWNQIYIGSWNSDLTSAARYYYSEEEPTEEGNYWHYMDGVVMKW